MLKFVTKIAYTCYNKDKLVFRRFSVLIFQNHVNTDSIQKKFFFS